MIRIIWVAFLIMLLTHSAFGQDVWVEDELPQQSTAGDTVLPEPVPLADPLYEDVAQIKQQLAELKASLQAFKMPSPAACECKCDCPTLEEIRGVVREELDRVTVTVKSTAGVERKVEIGLTNPDEPVIQELQPGDRVVAINGQPVTPFSYGVTPQGPVVQYTTPSFEMRTIRTPRGYFGAVRATSNTCRTVNGVRVCD